MKKTLMGYNKDDVESKMAEMQETIKMYECKISVLEDRFAQAQKTIMDINNAAKAPAAEQSNYSRPNQAAAAPEKPQVGWNNATLRSYPAAQNAPDKTITRNAQSPYTRPYAPAPAGDEKGSNQSAYNRNFSPAPAEYNQSSFARSYSSDSAESLEKTPMDHSRQLFTRSNQVTSSMNYEKDQPDMAQYGQNRPYNAAPPQSSYEKSQADRRQFMYAYDCASSIVKSSQKNVEDFISGISAQSAYAEEQAKKVLTDMQQMKVDLQNTVDSILQKSNDLQQQINDLIEQASNIPQSYNNFGQIQRDINKNIERQIYDYLQRSQEFLDQSQPAQDDQPQNYVWNQ